MSTTTGLLVGDSDWRRASGAKPARRLSALRWQLAVFDSAIVGLSCMAAWPLAGAIAGNEPTAAVPAWLPFALAALWLALLWAARSYDRELIDQRRVIWRVMRGTAYLLIVCSVSSYVFGIDPHRGAVLVALAVGAPALFIERRLGLEYVRWSRKRGHLRRDVIVVGSTRAVSTFKGRLDAVARLRVADTFVTTGIPEAELVERTLNQLRSARGAVVLLVGDHGFGDHETAELGRALQQRGIDLDLTADAEALPASRLSIGVVGNVPTVQVRLGRLDGGYAVLKRAVDITASFVLLCVLLPAMCLIALIIRRDGGPAFFVQPRVGRSGRLFPFYKYRSMRVNAHLERADVLGPVDDGLVERYRHDDRITRVGAFLRRWSLDELPQLINVLLGHMSLVGPRPLLEDELVDLADSDHRRHLTKPGLTGLWQINGRKERTFKERMRLDVRYVDDFSLAQDAAILKKTVAVVARGTGAY